jgi:hypothetical protein
MKMKMASLVLLIGVAVAGCGSDGDGGKSGPGTSGVEKSKSLSSLSADEKGKLCDWNAMLNGGYGKTMTCSDGTDTSNDEDRATCVSSIPPDCAATVGQFEVCSTVVVTVPLCDQITKLFASTQCQPLIACLTAAAP